MYKFVHEVHRDTYRVFYCELTGKTLEQASALPGMLSHDLVSSILLCNKLHLWLQGVRKAVVEPSSPKKLQ